ncbi:MAG: ThiF family adenylyltransferase [Bacteroidetes bacterium]|nr:ThiF family adenylyltransferase [Bacteroidota bacterium]
MDKTLIKKYIDETEQIEFVADFDDLLPFKSFQPLYVLLCDLLVDKQKVRVTLIVTKWFPNHLPKFILKKYDALGFLPHIEPNAAICYLEKESVYVNRDEPKVVFQASVELAVQTLKDGLIGTNHQDFREDFHVFWERNVNVSSKTVHSFIEITDSPKLIVVEGNDQKLILKDSDDVRSLGNKRSKVKSETGIYIPLNNKKLLIPPKYDEQWTADRFVNWLEEHVDDDVWDCVQDILDELNPISIKYIVFSVPRITGNSILAGVRLVPRNSDHPLLHEQSGWKMEYLNIGRLDPSAFLPRSGAKIELQSKKVLLVGCGSVGSHVALNLAKMGLGSITLVDNDLFSLENIHRFAIGFEYAYKSKVAAMKEFLNKNYLNTKVTSYSVSLENYLEQHGAELNQFDLVISATGDPTVNMFLNQLCIEKELSLIVAWNEPYGIGGHSQLSVPDKKGCYKCLYPELYNLASFASQDQPKPFHKKHLGCGEVFTPYNALDSSRTADLASRQCIAYLTDKEVEPNIRSWKGESDEFVGNGFNLSNRYLQQDQELMDKLKYDFVNPKCVHCN